MHGHRQVQNLIQPLLPRALEAKASTARRSSSTDTVLSAWPQTNGARPCRKATWGGNGWGRCQGDAGGWNGGVEAGAIARGVLELSGTPARPSPRLDEDSRWIQVGLAGRRFRDWGLQDPRAWAGACGAA